MADFKFFYLSEGKLNISKSRHDFNSVFYALEAVAGLPAETEGQKLFQKKLYEELEANMTAFGSKLHELAERGLNELSK
jgi:hypothetical protein